MKNIINKVLLLVVIICGGSKTGFTQKTSSVKIQYVCTPYGIKCDKEVFAGPGQCPNCKMKLVDKKSIIHKSVSPSDLSKFLLASQDKLHPLAGAFTETFKIRYQDKRTAVGLAWHYLLDEKIVGHNGGTLGARTESWINLQSKTHVIVFGDGNPGTMKTALSLLKQH